MVRWFRSTRSPHPWSITHAAEHDGDDGTAIMATTPEGKRGGMGVSTSTRRARETHLCIRSETRRLEASGRQEPAVTRAVGRWDAARVRDGSGGRWGKLGEGEELLLLRGIGPRLAEVTTAMGMAALTGVGEETDSDELQWSRSKIKRGLLLLAT